MITITISGLFGFIILMGIQDIRDYLSACLHYSSIAYKIARDINFFVVNTFLPAQGQPNFKRLDQYLHTIMLLTAK